MKYTTYIRNIQQAIQQYAEFVEKAANGIIKDETTIREGNTFDIMRTITFSMGNGAQIQHNAQKITELATMLSAPPKFVEMFRERKYTAYIIGLEWSNRQQEKQDAEESAK